MKKCIGIHDSAGLESFMPYGRINPQFLAARAQCNKHRRAVCYTVEVNRQCMNEIQKQINEQNYTQALKIIKQQKTYKVIA